MAGLKTFEGRANIGPLPSAVVDEGQAARALEDVGTKLSAQLGKMADNARAKEGQQEGLQRGKAAAETLTPLQLRNDATIYGENFDDAAMQAWSWRMDEKLTTDLAQAAIDNAESPAGYAKATDAIRAKFLKDGAIADVRQREVFDKSFLRRTTSDRLQIAANHVARVKREAAAAALSGIDTRIGDMERQAYNLGANPDGDAILTEEAGAITTAIEGAVADGSLSEAKGREAVNDLWNSAAYGRIAGVFDAIEDPAAQAKYAAGLMDEWAAGKGAVGKLSLSQVQDLVAKLGARASEKQSEQTVATALETQRYEQLIADDVASLAATGESVDLRGLGVDMSRVGALLGEAKVTQWLIDRQSALEVRAAVVGMEGESAAMIGERLTALQPKAGQAGFSRQAEIFELARKRADEVLEQRAVDPMGQADLAGLIELAPVDGSKESLAARGGQAGVVSHVYGTPVRFFTPGEAERLGNTLLDNPEQLVTFTQNAVTALGPYADTALAELSQAHREIAHATGIALSTGNHSVAEDIAALLAGKRDKRYTVKMPDGDIVAQASSIILNGAIADAAMQAQVMSTAGLLYEKDANASGFDPDPLGTEDSGALMHLEQALNRALGSRVINGVQWGGITRVNGSTTVAPSYLPADQLGELLAGLRDEDLASLPDILSGSGVPVAAEQIRRGRLIAVGDGIYNVMLGTPLEPLFVGSPDTQEGRWELDIRALQAARSRRKPPVQGITFFPGFGVTQ